MRHPTRKHLMSEKEKSTTLTTPMATALNSLHAVSNTSRTEISEPATQQQSKYMATATVQTIQTRNQVKDHGTIRASRHGHGHLAGAPRLPRKALNSWMAFRSFYKPIFPKLQQKNASTHLNTLWRCDPFKAKWAIIAAAYSRVRDAVGKPRAPLETFLRIVCPCVGIFGVDEYLYRLNWVCKSEDNGNVSLQQTSNPEFKPFESGVLTERDVIQLCAEKGYIQQLVATQINASNSRGDQIARQGLLAAAPVFPRLPKLRGKASLQAGTLPFAEPVLASSTDTNAYIFHSGSTSEVVDYQWTGNMSDLYNPTASNVDFPLFLPDESSSLWDVVDIDGPLSAEAFAATDEMYDRYLVPNILNDHLRDASLHKSL